MSNAVLPALPGLEMAFKRIPMHKTTMKETVSGREYRSRRMTSPRYTYKASYEFLRDKRQGYDELSQLLGFFNARSGAFDDWLFNDPDDNAVVNQLFGFGDGSTTVFQLVRSAGGFAEPVYAPNGASLYYSCYGGKASMNLLSWTAALANPVWLKNACTATDGGIAAPDGSNTASTITRGTAPVNHYVTQLFQISPRPGLPLTFSVWLRVGSLSGSIALRIRDGAGTEFGTAIVTPTASWARYSVSCTLNGAPAANLSVYIDPQDDGGVTGDEFYVWGPQLETAASASTGYWLNTSNYFAPGLDSTGKVTAQYAPPAGTQLTWNGSYYWRCRFLQDQLEFSKFSWRLWNLKTFDFITVKP